MSAEPTTAAHERQKVTKLKLTRWSVRAVLAAGVAASVVANILHAQDDVIARYIAAWPPLAFFAVVEVVSHVPMPRIWYKVIAMVGAVGIVGGVAAWISYWHMVSVTDRYGEQSPHMFPLSVDGLIVVASLALAELSSQIRQLTGEQAPLAAGMSWWLRRQDARVERKAARVARKTAKAEVKQRREQVEADRKLAAKTPPPVAAPAPEPPVIEKVEKLAAEQVAARHREVAGAPWADLKAKPLPGWTPPEVVQQPVPPVQPEPQPEPAPEVPTEPAPPAPPEKPREDRRPVKPRSGTRKAPANQAPANQNEVAEKWIAEQLRSGRQPSLTEIGKRYAVEGRPRSENWATARRKVARELAQPLRAVS